MSHLCDPLTLALLGAAISLFSFWAGHRTALWRDIRKDLNPVLDRLRPILRQDVERPTPYSCANADDLEKLIAYSSFGRRWLVRRRVAAYKAATQQQRVQDAVGQAFFVDPALVSRAAAALLQNCAPR